MAKPYEIATKGVRAGTARSEFQEHSEALFLTSSFVFKSAKQAAARFAGEDQGMVYTRYTNPTVSMFQDRLAALEGAESCVATASGMAAILTTALVHLKAGDHVVCSNAVFGATIQLFNNVLSRFGVETSYVSPTKVDEWRKAARKNTRLFFLETPSNPLTEISDLPALAEVAKKAGALLAVDNVFCTPALQRPLELGADMVIHSATKYLDGQGRVIAGAVAGSKKLVGDPMTVFLRNAGPTISPFNAWVVLKGLETLELRMLAQSAAALQLAQWLESHPKVSRVHYPGLESHPQHALAKRQQRAGGSVVSFEVKGGREAAWRVIDSTRLVSVTANLGDVKTTIIHPASTTHGRITPEARAA
jgi:O-succinylhomoserine sulfhydrylase